MKLYRGQKVKIKTYAKRPGRWNSDGMMDVWMGKSVTIANPHGVTLMEDKDNWIWREEDFQQPQLLEDDLFDI